MVKKYLFYFIHPAKFHAFRHTINRLKKSGNHVDVAIITKDMIEDLVKAEGWNYSNIFPEGRRIKYLHTYVSAAINLIRTVYRLFKLTHRKKYDLIVTDDLATIVGRIKGIPTIFFTDDDLKAVPESAILIATANYILCPAIAHMGMFNKKKIGYQGLKALAHLHPNQFIPDISKLNHDLDKDIKKYYMIRCVSVTSTHDVGKKGINDQLLVKLVKSLEKHGRVIINSQRELPSELNSYNLEINKSDIAHYLYYSKIFISDSTTMCAEAAILGVPSIEIDDWFSDFEQYKLLSDKFQLLMGFYPREEEKILEYLNTLLKMPELNAVYNDRRNLFLREHIDLTEFMIWLFGEYPESVKEFKSNPQLSLRYTK